jgi:hypothetical protein
MGVPPSRRGSLEGRMIEQILADGSMLWAGAGPAIIGGRGGGPPMALIANITSEQSLQVGVNGPNDVANMHVVTGIANGSLNAFAPTSGGFVSQQATYAAHIGPSLTHAQFRKAIASAAIT